MGEVGGGATAAAVIGDGSGGDGAGVRPVLSWHACAASMTRPYSMGHAMNIVMRQCLT